MECGSHLDCEVAVPGCTRMAHDGPGWTMKLPAVPGRSWGCLLCSLSLCYLGSISISLCVEMSQQELQKYNSWGKVAWNTASLREQQQ